MIDCHCHLEQPEFDQDRDEVIRLCREAGIKAIVTCCAHPRDWEKSLEICQRYQGFVFLTAALHPEFIEEFSSQQISGFLKKLEENAGKLVGIGETGLDFYWVKDEKQRERQEGLFRETIQLAKRLGKPLVIHARDAVEPAIRILEEEGAKRVCMHMFGANQLTSRVIENGWWVSLNLILERSKKHRKVARDMPLERILLETDSPWLGQGRNDPRSIRRVAELIAEIKKLEFQEVWQACGRNAVEFFDLQQISSP